MTSIEQIQPYSQPIPFSGAYNPLNFIGGGQVMLGVIDGWTGKLEVRVGMVIDPNATKRGSREGLKTSAIKLRVERRGTVAGSQNNFGMDEFAQTREVDPYTASFFYDRILHAAELRN